MFAVLILYPLHRPFTSPAAHMETRAMMKACLLPEILNKALITYCTNPSSLTGNGRCQSLYINHSSPGFSWCICACESTLPSCAACVHETQQYKTAHCIQKPIVSRSLLSMTLGDTCARKNRLECVEGRQHLWRIRIVTPHGTSHNTACMCPREHQEERVKSVLGNAVVRVRFVCVDIFGNPPRR